MASAVVGGISAGLVTTLFAQGHHAERDELQQVSAGRWLDWNSAGLCGRAQGHHAARDDYGASCDGPSHRTVELSTQ